MPVGIKYPDKDSITVRQSAIPRVLLEVAPFLQGSYTAIMRYSGCYADPHKHRYVAALPLTPFEGQP